MKNKRVTLDYFEDILDAIEKITIFVEAMTEEQFLKDTKTVFAVIRALEILGEAAKKIPEKTREKYPNIPWRAMSGMRDKLIHDYIGVNLKVVWRTIGDDLPGLEKGIRDIISLEQS